MDLHLALRWRLSIINLDPSSLLLISFYMYILNLFFYFSFLLYATPSM